MRTFTEIDKIRDEVLLRVRKLDKPLISKYEDAITTWLIREVLEVADDLTVGGIYDNIYDEKI